MLIRNSTFPGRLQNERWEPVRPTPQPLLAEINAFMHRHRMSWTRYSRDIADDYHRLYDRLRDGEGVLPRTEAKLRARMARHDAGAK